MSAITIRTPDAKLQVLDTRDVEKITMLREVYNLTWDQLARRYNMKRLTLRNQYHRAKEQEGGYAS
jgi:DNA-binding transcriptional regulator YiaG